MRIAVVYDGPDDISLAMTSVCKGLRRKFGQHPITWITGKKNMVFFKRLPGSLVKDISKKTEDHFDVLIGYGHTNEAIRKAQDISADIKYGLCGCDKVENTRDSELAAQILYGSNRTDRNPFQVLYSIANMSWHGEGYGFKYFPRNKQKFKTGIAVQDDISRERLMSVLKDEDLYRIPIRQNPLKQFDEVNRCKSIITDNNFVMHVAVNLHKHVEFLLYQPPLMKMEFFGHGGVHIVPEELRFSMI